MATTDLPEVVYRSLYKEPKKPHRKELVQPIHLVLSNGQFIAIPAGFITDLASVPRLFWGIISPSGRHDLAVIIHDYLLGHGYSRRFADKEMLYWLTLSKVAFLKRQVMFRLVRSYSAVKEFSRGRILKQ